MEDEPKEQKEQEAVKPDRFKSLPTAVKYLLLINGIVFFITFFLFYSFEINIIDIFALHNPQSHKFAIYQLFTHLFLHGNFFHIFLNMFILWMFGHMLESLWGKKRFLVYYFFTGLGAAVLHLGVSAYEIHQLRQEVESYNQNPGYEAFIDFIQEETIADIPPQHPYYQSVSNLVEEWQDQKQNDRLRSRSTQLAYEYLQMKIDIPTLGASGAVYGVLLGFGVLFPNVPIFLYFLFPIKAKYFVIALGLIELTIGVTGWESGIANFAHLGGMIFGFALLKYWRIKPTRIEGVEE